MIDFLAERFAPVRRELTEEHLDVRGTVPDWLDGRYVRNGPNPVAQARSDTYNWFTGDGMVHGVRLCGGDALWYRNRWVGSEVTSHLLGRSAPRERGHSALHGPSANTNVIEFAGRTLALVEGGAACAELSRELDTVDVCDFDGSVRGGYTAHPLRDPDTGDLHAVSYHFGRGNTVRYTVIGADGGLRRALDIPVGGSPMMHAFSLTREYVVVYDLPVTFDARSAVEISGTPGPLAPLARFVLGATVGRIRFPRAVMNRVPAVPAGAFPYRWDPGYAPRVGLLPRTATDASSMTWIDLDASCYVFHPLNAHDDGSVVQVDLVVHEKVFDADRTGPTEGRPRLERWRIDVPARTIHRERLSGEHMEFPRIDERRVGRVWRHGWAVSGTDDFSAEHRLVRTDGRAGVVARRDFGEHSSVGEFTFVPRDEDAPEGDGVVLGFVSDLAADSTDLRILDALTLEDVAAVRLPQRVPVGFHGNWMS